MSQTLTIAQAEALANQALTTSGAGDPGCPDVGQWFLAMDLAAMDHPERRIEEYLDRLASMDAYIPGQDRQDHFDNAAARGITVPDDLHETLQSRCRTA